MWEEAGKSLTARLFATSEPALVFWVWATAVWFIGGGGWSSFVTAVTPLFTDASAAQLLVVAVVAACVPVLTGVIVDRFTLPMLRVLEGYGWVGFGWAARRRTKVWQGKLDSLENERAAAGIIVAAEAEAAVKLRGFPTRADVMPTRVGNILRAGERRPRYWYGLDAVVVWPQLWLVLPEQPRNDIHFARARLDSTVTTFAWCLLSCLLGFLWWPAALIGAAVSVAVWRIWVPAAATSYATVLSAVFDTHRFLLYEALRYPLPATPAEEPTVGADLTGYLWNGTPQPNTYTDPHPPTESRQTPEGAGTDTPAPT